MAKYYSKMKKQPVIPHTKLIKQTDNAPKGIRIIEGQGLWLDMDIIKEVDFAVARVNITYLDGNYIEWYPIYNEFGKDDIVYRYGGPLDKTYFTGEFDEKGAGIFAQCPNPNNDCKSE